MAPDESAHTPPQQSRRAAQQLAALFRDADKPPVFLLGAGASYRSGVPMAADAVWWVVERHFSRYVRGGQLQVPRRSEVELWLRKEHADWFNFEPDLLAENFPEAVDRLLTPDEFRREVLHDLVEARNGINDGYRDLARLMQRGLCRTVLTTNFDRLVHAALKSMEPHVRHVVEVNQVPGDFDQFSLMRRFQVVYLHGSVEHYRDRNTRRETADLDAEVAKAIAPLLRDWPLIVIGYRGAEPSVMKALLGRAADERTAFRNGLYWCTRGDGPLHSNVEELARKVGRNFRRITIDGFDELMAELNFVLREVDHFGKGIEEQTPLVAPDELPVVGANMEEIDRELALATLTRWAQRVQRGAVTPENYDSLMLDLRLAAKTNEAVVPTMGGLLLFGKKPQDRFPHAFVRVLIGHTQRVVDGNLIAQSRSLRELLAGPDINPVLRIKTAQSSEERPAYPERVLTETIVNMLVHRDYGVEQYAEISIVPGRSIRFLNPGGLPKDVLARVAPDRDGRFVPVREATETRNPCLADIFFGEGSMDRQGSGLPDVLVLSKENGGDARFSVQGDNTRFEAELMQPFQASPGSSTVARPISASGRYITNHLPFQMLPDTVYSIPAKDRQVRRTESPSLFFQQIQAGQPLARGEAPVWAGGYKAGMIYSFANLEHFPLFSEQRGHLSQLRMQSREIMEETPEGRRILSWLLRRHFDHHLEGFGNAGLVVDRKRAFFVGASGDERTITYDSAKRRGVRRVMVKRREVGRSVFHENEGIWYSVEWFAGMWCVRLKPTYVFTEADGATPLPPFRVSRLATRRFRFDRNKNVDDDMTFWVRFLGQGRPVIGIGGPSIDNLILALDYVGFDVPEMDDDEHPDQDFA